MLNCKRRIDDQKVIAAMVIEPDFDAKIDAGKSATVGLVLDGRSPMPPSSWPAM